MTLKYLSFVLLLCSAIAHAEDYKVDAETGYRMERYRAPVPTSVPGAITVDTAFVKRSLENKTLTLIDVYPPTGLGPDPFSGEWITPDVRKTIPGATWLPDVGRGYLEPELEAYFRRNLIEITNNDLSAAIMFFCTSDCWQSWNASVRAHSWGYTNVHWYPTGSDGWREEGGEVTIVQPVNFLKGTPDEVVFPENARVLLSGKNSKAVDIGHITFGDNGTGEYGIDVEIDSESFNDHFLSMRPFKCIDDSAEWYCYQPYPYDLNNVVTINDVTDLEYHLLFIRKTAKEFGIDAWNGMYFQLTRHVDGVWRGQLLEGDLNVLQSPPESGNKPIDLSEFIEADADIRRFTEITLQPIQ